jgi:hypothetical protein
MQAGQEVVLHVISSERGATTCGPSHVALSHIATLIDQLARDIGVMAHDFIVRQLSEVNAGSYQPFAIVLRINDS